MSICHAVPIGSSRGRRCIPTAGPDVVMRFVVSALGDFVAVDALMAH